MMMNSVKAIGLLAALALSMAVSAARADFPLKSGDRIVFLGDSITEQRVYTRYVMNYFTLRYPGLDLTFRNAGWGGDIAPGGLSRLQRDVLSLKPSVVTICYGMNDGGYTAFDPKRYDAFMKGMSGLVAELKKANIRVILMGPGCVDYDQPGFRNMVPQAVAPGVNYNDTLRKYSQGVKELAEKEKVAYFDLHDLMFGVQTKAKAKDPKYSIIPGDGVHPREPGHVVMAYALLKALGCKDQASGLEIDAATSKATPDRCKVDDLKVTSTALSFTRTDEALPTALDAAAASSMEFFPFTQELNQYKFKVAGLAAGNWKLTVEGIDVGTFSEKDLTAGVNLAMLPGPWQKLGEKVNAASKTQEDTFYYAWRVLARAWVAPPEPLKADMEAVTKKAYAIVDEMDASRLKIVPKDRAWKWTLTLQEQSPATAPNATSAPSTAAQ